jgi:serine/threonine-protein kinase
MDDEQGDRPNDDEPHAAEEATEPAPSGLTGPGAPPTPPIPATPAPGTIAPAPGTIAPAPGTIAPSTTGPAPSAGAGEAAGVGADADRDRIAAALPNYEIGEQLGKGGWGVVYSGRHKQLGREVAIKQLPQGFSSDPEVRARFVAEARTLAALDHPHVVPIYDYVEHEGLCLLVMEKLSGGTVWSRFAGEGLSMEAACAAALATCAGLQGAHSHQILHRDIKPENLIFNAEGTLKVTDFGIAKMLGGTQTLATRAGEVIGTPAYMAPEQARGHEVTPATDVYAVGVMLYELLSGRRPFADEDDPLALLFKHAYDEPMPLGHAAPHVPKPLSAVVMKALAKDPADRYQGAEEMGIAVAEAATEAWGPGWLMRASLPVMAASSIVAATQRVTSAPDGGTGQSPVSVTVRPQTGVRPRATLGPSAPEAADFLPVEDVVPKPPSSLPAWAGTALLLAAVVLMAFGLRIGEPELERAFPAGTLTVAGQDPAGTGVVNIDMAHNFVVAGRLPAPAAELLDVSFSAAGVSMGAGRSIIQKNSDGTFTTQVDGSASRFLLTGRGTGRISFLDASGEALLHQEFVADSTQQSFLTAPFVGAFLVLFFLLGYVESMVRALRRGRGRVGSLIGLPLLAVPIGVAVTVVAWGATGVEPTRDGVVATSAVAALAGLAAGWGSLRSGRRRQYARAQARVKRDAAEGAVAAHA